MLSKWDNTKCFYLLKFMLQFNVCTSLISHPPTSTFVQGDAATRYLEEQLSVFALELSLTLQGNEVIKLINVPAIGSN